MNLVEAMAGATATKAARKDAAKRLRFSSSQAGTLALALKEDSQDFFYSACMTLVDGLRGLHCGFYTWATVKLYYSVFYSLRAWLAAEGVCSFYLHTSPFSVEAAAGAIGVAGKGTTHVHVQSLFARRNPQHRFVAQTIDQVMALDWLTQRREDSNYKTPRFSEPIAPRHFNEVEKYGIRRCVAAYLADTTDVYTFDKDHAMLALPLKVIGEAVAVVRGSGAVRFAHNELSMLSSSCCDDAGPIAQMATMFKTFA
ncbi:MAG: hypothetical protein KF774_22065 [Planctomyces sp.]|nr:hypothetical protein [Planctomyces sp.]